jgi:SAM-dependent methyltransferase
MLELVRSRALAEGLENLQPLAVPRAPSSTNPYAVIQVDRVLLNSVVDVVPSPRELFVQVAALLKPGGRVVVVYPRLYPDFSPTADLPCAKARDWVRQLPSGSPFEAAFRDAGLPSNGNSACPTGGFARALNSLLADQAFFPRFAALTRALGGGPNALLELNSTEEARGVFRAAFLQHQLASGKPRAGTLRVLTWSALVGTFGLESQSWGYALGRGIYLPREALVKLAQGAGLRLEGSLDQVPRYLVLVFGKPEASQ